MNDWKETFGVNLLFFVVDFWGLGKGVNWREVVFWGFKWRRFLGLVGGIKTLFGDTPCCLGERKKTGREIILVCVMRE